MPTPNAAIDELQTQSLALAEAASELISRTGGSQGIEDPLPSCQELLDIVLSLLIVDAAPFQSVTPFSSTQRSRAFG